MNTEQFDGHTPGPWYLNTPDPNPARTVRFISDVCTDLLGASDADARLIAAAPDLLAEVKRWREECEAQQAYARALHAQLTRATEWAYQQFCYDKSKMEHFDNHVWGEENAP